MNSLQKIGKSCVRPKASKIFLMEKVEEILRTFPNETLSPGPGHQT